MLLWRPLPNHQCKNRCLGVSDWKPPLGTEEGTGETGEGSGASGEDAWGTPSSGDLSDNLPDSEHGTLSVSVINQVFQNVISNW